MKKAPLIIVLLIGLGILGYVFLNKQNNVDDLNNQDEFYFSEEENNSPVTPNNSTQVNTTTPTQNASGGTNTSNLKLFTRTNYSFKAPKEWIESGPRNFDGCLWDGISNDTSDGHRQAGEIGIYPKSCFDISKANGYKEMKEIDGYYILAYYDSGSGTTAQEEAETKSVYQNIISTFIVNPPAQGGGNTTTIMVPLIISSESEFASADFGPFGCGAYISFVQRQVPQTSAVLNATYNWLFSNPSSFDGGNYYNTIATQTNLDFQSVEIVNGVAKVYLTGSVMGAHCGDATFAAQIEQTAFQYPTVEDIEVYVNGEIFDWCDISDADPEESGCDTTPKLWNSQRIFEM